MVGEYLCWELRPPSLQERDETDVLGILPVVYDTKFEDSFKPRMVTFDLRINDRVRYLRSTEPGFIVEKRDSYNRVLVKYVIYLFTRKVPGHF